MKKTPGIPETLEVCHRQPYFVPTITVTAGQAIVWTHTDAVPHSVTSDQGLFDSGDIGPGQSYSLTLDKPGTYTYHCMHHPYMKGTVIVTP